ncbi:thioesterase-like superfamily-domain-containing protein [Hyaloraphidium curvatum]|nr:thioesterase-like superfamily-domain-containing protein [Hyaloraphidium curvatum]
MPRPPSYLDSHLPLEPVSPGRFSLVPSPEFLNANGVAHGGYILAAALSAAMAHAGEKAHPLTAHCSYFSAVVVDTSRPWDVSVREVRKGRRFTSLEVDISAGGKLGTRTAVLLSADPAGAQGGGRPLASLSPSLPPPSACIPARPHFAKSGIPILEPRELVELVAADQRSDVQSYWCYIGWPGTPFGGARAAGYFVDALVSLGVRAALAPLFGGRKGRHSWSTLTMTVDFPGPFPETAPPGSSPYDLVDGTEIFAARQSLSWIAGGPPDGVRVQEEVEIWDPRTGRVLARSKQQGLMEWVDEDAGRAKM